MIETIDNHLNGFLEERGEFSHISEGLKNKLVEWDKCKKPIERPRWDYYFLALSHIIALRSPDARTKHGCVLTTQNNEIISTGYNGFCRKIDERILPNFTGEKYPYILHSELNCLLNCARLGKSTLNSVMYISGPPCMNCIQTMWQAGVTKVVHANRSSKMIENQEYKDDIELFQLLTQKEFPIIHIDFDETKILELLK